MPKLVRTARIAVAFVLVVAVVAGALALMTSAPTMAAKPCTADDDCKKGAICVGGNCVKPIIDCSVVLCLPCPPGTKPLGVFPDCCRCVPSK